MIVLRRLGTTVMFAAAIMLGTGFGNKLLADYLATVPGSGTTFASVIVSAKHYAAFMLCDFVAGESQCAAVNGSGQVAIQAPPTLPLPTGAATSANQPTNAAIGSTTSGQTGHLIIGAVTTAAPTYVNLQSDPLSLDTAGNLRINCITGCSSSGGTGLVDAAAFTQTSTSLTVAGAIFSTAVTNLTNGQGGALRSTNDRKLMVDTPNIETTGLTTGASAAANAAQVAGVFTSGTPSLTSGQAIALQVTTAGSLHTTVDNNVTIANFNTNGQATSANSSPVVPSSNWINDQCFGTAVKISKNITQTTSTQLINGNGNTTYICSLVLVTATAQNIALVEGVGSTCATTTAGVIGGTTAATGLNLGVNSGITLGSGAGSVAIAGAVAGDNVCLLQSGAGQVSGVITYVQH